MTSRCCTARRSLACSSSGISPISSRNSVPRWAARNRPGCADVAPVKAPFSWPKSWLSNRCALTAAQLTVTSSPVRLLSRCSSAATLSLPVPVGPMTRAGDGSAAARAT